MTSPLVRHESTHNQATGYDLTSPLWIRVDYPCTGWPGYGSVKLWVDLIPALFIYLFIDISIIRLWSGSQILLFFVWFFFLQNVYLTQYYSYSDERWIALQYTGLHSKTLSFKLFISKVCIALKNSLDLLYMYRLDIKYSTVTFRSKVWTVYSIVCIVLYYSLKYCLHCL